MTLYFSLRFSKEFVDILFEIISNPCFCEGIGIAAGKWIFQILQIIINSSWLFSNIIFTRIHGNIQKHCKLHEETQNQTIRSSLSQIKPTFRQLWLWAQISFSNLLIFLGRQNKLKREGSVIWITDKEILNAQHKGKCPAEPDYVTVYYF